METKIEATKSIRFFTVVNSKAGADLAKLMIESLRTFGGALRDRPVWVFLPDPNFTPDFSALGRIECFPLQIEEPFRSYILAPKVFACARAEELAGTETRFLVWLNLDCLIVNPPILFELGGSFDAAFRPVHIRNVGSPISDSLDDYWKKVYQAVGITDAGYSVESFVDGQVLRPYFNTHCFSINPARGILQEWREIFKTLVLDRDFQASQCHDEQHQIFLHQVVLSALMVKSLRQDRIRILPPPYSYPLHLVDQLPVERRISILNQTVCPVYEESDPIKGIDVEEPLRSWLIKHRR